MDVQPSHPFFALVGHSGELHWNDAAVAYITLYHRLSKGASLEEAISAMRAAAGEIGFVFEFWRQAQERLFSIPARGRRVYDDRSQRTPLNFLLFYVVD